MHAPLHPPTRIAIGMYPDLAGAKETAGEIFNALQKEGLQPIMMDSLSNEGLRRCIEQTNLDVLIALGGDGTMLRAERICAPYQLPVFGINLGHFGFLMEVDQNDWRELLPFLIKGNYLIEKRLMLHCEHWRADVLLDEKEAVNDVVISRGSIIRPIRLSTEIDGYPLTNYVADGLIISTPTGSTAYALAVQGPVLAPELRNILIVPVAPHLSVDCPIVISAQSCVRVVVHTNHEAVLSPDGRRSIHLNDGDVVIVKASQNEASFIRLCNPGYFYHNLTRYLKQNPSAGNL